MTELYERTLSEVGELVARRALSCTELTQATLDRIEATEPEVHAYAHVFADAALDDARQADRELAEGHWRGPLHGVPIGIKDLVYVRDQPTEAGSRVLAGFVPSYDATVVRKLREAGAIIVGKTVTNEFAWGVNFTVTRNPWDPSCYPGGSSVGSGVAVSVRSAFAAIGTDTGGSIRIPASVNGVVGLKPTFGRVSRHGIISMSESFDSCGPLTRTVDDCAILFGAIAGHDEADPSSLNEPVPDYREALERGVEGLTIGVERDYYFYEGVTHEVRYAVEAVIAEYEAMGAKIVEVELPEFALMTVVDMTIIVADASANHRHLLRERGTDYDPSTRVMLELGELLPATHYVTALRARALLCRRVKDLFRDNSLDAMLWPTTPLVTVPLEQVHATRENGESPMTSYVHHTASANVLGLPALSVPCGLSSDRLPIAFQLLGRPFEEARLFRIARAYERAHAWDRLSPPI